MNLFPHFVSLHLLGWPLHLYFALNVLQCHASNIGSGWTNICLSVSIYIGFCIEQIGSRQFAILTSHTNQRGWKYSVPYILRSIPHFCTCAQICSSIKKVKESEVVQSYPTLCGLMDSSLPGSSVHGIFQARVLEWVAISFSNVLAY